MVTFWLASNTLGDSAAVLNWVTSQWIIKSLTLISKCHQTKKILLCLLLPAVHHRKTMFDNPTFDLQCQMAVSVWASEIYKHVKRVKYTHPHIYLYTCCGLYLLGLLLEYTIPPSFPHQPASGPATEWPRCCVLGPSRRCIIVSQSSVNNKHGAFVGSQLSVKMRWSTVNKRIRGREGQIAAGVAGRIFNTPWDHAA